MCAQDTILKLSARLQFLCLKNLLHVRSKTSPPPSSLS